MRRWKFTSAWASIPARPISRCAASCVLPAGLGKIVRVLVFAQGDAARLAQESGADFVVSDDEGFKKIQDGWTDWDVTIAMADMMGKAGRLGKVLGPRGLMPSPKAGNITQSAGDLPRMITEAKAGRVEFRVDKTAGVHVPIGKASFTHRAVDAELWRVDGCLEEGQAVRGEGHLHQEDFAGRHDGAWRAGRSERGAVDGRRRVTLSPSLSRGRIAERLRTIE